jgi:hypothetical protein
MKKKLPEKSKSSSDAPEKTGKKAVGSTKKAAKK